MARGGDDSDEERHDRFRSERGTTSLKPLSGFGQKRVGGNAASQDDWRTRERRRSRDRSRSRRSRERSSEKRRRNSEETSRHYRKTHSEDREDRKKNRHRERRSPSRDEYKAYRKNRGSSSERQSDSQSSLDSRGDRKTHKHSERSRNKDRETGLPQANTYVHKFDRRRDSSVEEEVVDNNIIYRDSSTSPEPLKHKKKRNGEKLKKKDKRKEKKKKKKSRSLDKSSDDSNAVLGSSSASFSQRINDNSFSSSKDDDSIEKDQSSIYGPVMPPKSSDKLDGPTVPSSSPEESLPGNRDTQEKSSDKTEKDFYGPLLPKCLNKESSDKKSNPSTDTASGEGEEEERKEVKPTYGPQLPPRSPITELGEDDLSYGPALPPRLLKTKSDPVDEEDDGGFGPLPAGLGGRTQEELEIRAALIKRQLAYKEDDDRPKKREEWMTVLPDARRAELGLGPRKFRAREGPDMSDRSSWTDTPEEKRRREEMSKLGVITEADDDDNINSKQLGIIARDREMETKAREKKKEKSLLALHQKGLKKKKKEAKDRGEKEERRPFNREVDLQTNKFDEAQKKSIIKKAQLLDSRFSRGESKYL